jgi:dTDP-4-amino-4,6-dideoxygalactose transaminase
MRAGVHFVNYSCSVGATVVFCDVAEEHGYIPSVRQVPEALTPATEVLLIPNLLANRL